MKTLTAGKPVSKFLWLYAIVLTAAFLVLIFHERIPQRILQKASSLQPETEMQHYQKEHWLTKTDLYDKLSTHNKIVFVGNSITENCNWNELFSSDKIANRGIGGDRSSGILRRIDTYLIDSPTCIVLMDGINDLLNNIPVDSVTKNFDVIARKVLERKVPLIVQSTLYASKGYGSVEQAKTLNLNIDTYNQHISSYCKQHSIPYVDVNSSLSKDGLLQDKYTIDGVHISGIGYERWREVLQPYLNHYL